MSFLRKVIHEENNSLESALYATLPELEEIISSADGSNLFSKPFNRFKPFTPNPEINHFSSKMI